MEIFALTKREQQVVIVIVLALVVGTIAMHYRDLRTPAPKSATTSDAIVPEHEEEAPASDETP